MPSQMRSQTPTTQPATGVTGDRSTTQTGGAQGTIGNQALQAAMAEKSAGQLSWEAALGEALGSKLYEALSKQLAQDELRKAAESAVGSAMKALGVPHLLSYLCGRISKNQAIEGTQRATRNYVKRQFTWFQRQIIADLVVKEKFSNKNKPNIFSKISKFLLTKLA